MTRRDLRRGSVLFIQRFLAVLAALACLSTAERALAEPQLSGAVDGRALIGIANRHGGALAVDLWAGSRSFRFGGVFGVGAISKRGDISSRVFTPLGLSLGLMPQGDRSGPTATVRFGAYAGAQKDGLMLGPFASCALGYRVSLGEGASIRFGADSWLLLMNEGSLFLGPYVGLGF